MRKAKIGELWVAMFPIIFVDEENDIIKIEIEKRPCLIIDDGRGFIVEENCDYAGLKITGEDYRTKREEIKNWKKLGLRKKSYVRIELPLKIESQQLLHKISQMPIEQLEECLKKLFNTFNLKTINTLVEEKVESRASAN